MWSTLSSSRWVFLLSLAAVLLYSEGSGQIIRLPCCRKLIQKTSGEITKCFEQKPRWRCNVHAYVIKKQNGRIECIDPNSPWIQEKLAELCRPPWFGGTGLNTDQIDEPKTSPGEVAPIMDF